MADILNTLPDSLGPLQEIPLVESRRSAQPIIDVVNKVFGNVSQLTALDKCQDGLSAWGRRFEQHTTFKKAAPGYVCLETGPAQQDGQNVPGQRGQHCEYVAKQIRDLAQRTPGRSIGVLCRKNDTVARMIYELRKLRVEASEEGGNALTDSPAVEVILSLFTLADHPGHSIAWFHLKNSPLQEHLVSFADPATLAGHLRRQLLANGYGQLTHAWAKALSPACNRRDLSRLQQVVEMAYAFQPRSNLRAGDFVAWVRQQRVPDPSAANVRVMTIHGAKGLQFDVVVLPELDAGLTGKPPAFVVDRDPKSLDVTFVCRYADETTRNLLTEEERCAFDKDRQHRVEESLSLLYVALTRAVHALYLYIPGPRGRKENDAWYNLLVTTLTPGTSTAETALLYEHGDRDWFKRLTTATPQTAPPEPEQRRRVVFRTGETERRRGMEHVAPSRREGQARVVLDRLFHPSEGTGTTAGTLYHAWFATIGWLDDALPTDAALRAAAERIRADLPAETWRDLDRLLATFRTWLENAAINAVLRRSAYADPQQLGFPAALAPFWMKSLAPQQVERERRFLVREGTKFWTGSLDRIVWLGDGDRTVAADVIDFKTDAIPPGDAAALAARTDHYRPQLEAYRRAVAHLAQLPEERVATRLVFTCAGRIADV
jgi:ATP-dependent exoDNAse (exonuclease V) beta subunit